MNFNLKIILFTFFTGLCQLSQAQKDVVTISNNKTIEGEIEGMKNGILSFSTFYSDSDFMIEWEDVKSIESERYFVFVLSTGDRFTGGIKNDSTNTTSLAIYHDGQFYVVNKDLIVEIVPIEKSFWSKWSGELSVGYTLTKANRTQQFNANGKLAYLSEVSNLTTSASIIRNYLNDSATNRRSEYDITYKYLITNRLFATIGVNFLQNEEQKLKLRSTGQAGLGRFLFRTHNSHCSYFGGIAWNNETYTTPDSKNLNSAEGWIGLDLKFNEIDDIDFSLTGNAYPGITVKDRVRANLNTSVNFDLIWDLYFNVSFQYNFDSKPPESAVKHDYVLITAFGWSF